MVVLHCVPVLGWAGDPSSASHPFGMHWDHLHVSYPSLVLSSELPGTPAADEQQPPKRWLHDFVYRELVKHFGKLQDEKDYINVRYYYY